MSRKQLLIVICALACFAIFQPVVTQAWEFGLQASWEWKYEYYNQHGANGFFGPYNVDNGPGDMANLNFWNGGQFDTNFTSSGSAGMSSFQMDFFPTFQINPAIRISGKYRLGEYGNPYNSKYYTQEAPGVNNAFTEGQWTLLWGTAQTPWGVFGIGKRLWAFGAGLQYDGNATSTESILLSTPYGPFDFGLGYYPYRYVGFSRYSELYGLGDPFDLITVTPGIERRYYSLADKSGSTSRDFLAFVTYTQGALQSGILANFGAFHLGPEASLYKTQPIAQDSDYTHGTFFAKYSGPTFFVNAEAAWMYWTDRYSDPTGLFIQYNIPNTTRYIEQWRFMVELGLLAGPAKFSLLAAQTPGPDRRNGRLIDRQPAAFVWHPSFDERLGNFSLFRQYSYLLSYNYGSGLGAYDLNHDGYMRDAFVLAARIDYAAAANLNISISSTWAERTSNGYSWGCLGPIPSAGALKQYGDIGQVDICLNRYPGAPNIPDRSLGFEIDAGIDWQLLEGWQVGMVFGYWRPGKWFNYACIDRSVPNWQIGTALNFFGVRPNRTIDPVTGGEFYCRFDF